MTLIENPERKRLRQGEQLAVGEIETIDSYRSSMMKYETGLQQDPAGRFFERRVVKVGDESDPETRQKFLDKAEAYEKLLSANKDSWTPTHIDEETKQLLVDPMNLPAVDLYYDEHGRETLMTRWGSQMMQAIALEPLQNLSKGGRFLPEGRLDRRTLELFTNMPDGIGLRSRQHIYAELVAGHALRGEQGDMQVVSLGSGASVPNIEAAQSVAEVSDRKIHWQFYDLDPNALKSADLMLNEANLGNSTFDFGPKASEDYEGRNYIEARQIDDESVDVVDALGLWEYLRESNARTFLGMMYPKLKEGGAMIVSNMKIDRPQPLYNQYAVGWPKLIMRSEQDMLDIVQKAGIPTDKVTITHPDDGVYMVMEVRK